MRVERSSTIAANRATSPRAVRSQSRRSQSAVANAYGGSINTKSKGSPGFAFAAYRLRFRVTTRALIPFSPNRHAGAAR